MSDRHTLQQRKIRRDMNLALDDQLDDGARSELKAHLMDSSEDARLWDNMRTVDRLFSAAPLCEAPSDFAAKVMATIVSGKVPKPVRQRQDGYTMSGLALTTLILLPLVIGTVLYAQQLLANPEALNTVVRQLSWLVNTVVQNCISALRIATSNTFLVLTSTTLASLILFMMWVRVPVVLTRRQQVVYRIPVISG